MPLPSPLVAAAQATARLAAGCNLSGADLATAIAAFRELSASSAPSPMPTGARPEKRKRGRPKLDRSGSKTQAESGPTAPVVQRKLGRPKLTPATAPVSAAARSGLKLNTHGSAKVTPAVLSASSTTWSWKDVPAKASEPMAAPAVAKLPRVSTQEAMLRRVAGILKAIPVRLGDAASVSLSRATGKAIGRDLVRDLAQFANGRLQVTFGFAHRSAVYIGEIDPASADGEIALQHLAQCAATALNNATWFSLERNLPKLRLVQNAA